MKSRNEEKEQKKTFIGREKQKKQKKRTKKANYEYVDHPIRLSYLDLLDLFLFPSVFRWLKVQPHRLS